MTLSRIDVLVAAGAAPLARGKGAFVKCENALLVAERMGLGPADLQRIFRRA